MISINLLFRSGNRAPITGRLGFILLAALFLLVGCQPARPPVTPDTRTDIESQRFLQPVPHAIRMLKETRLPAPLILSDLTTEDTLTLENAISLARHNNPDLLITAARLDRAKARHRQARSAFYPRIGVYTEYTQGDAPSGYLFKTIDQRQLAPQTDFNRPGWFENYESGIQGRWNLFHGFQDLREIGVAEQHIAIAAFGQIQAEQVLIAMVTSLYYQTLAAADYINIAEESASTVTEQLRVMQVRFDAGGALKSDLLSLEVRKAQAQEDIVRSTTSYHHSRAALAELLGLPPNQMPNLQTPPSRSADPSVTALTEAQGQAQAQQQRPEIQQARREVLAARLALEQACGGFLPRLDLTGTYYVDDARLAYSRARDNWLLALTLHWNIWDGQANRAAVAQARAALVEALAAERKVQLAVERDVHSAFLRWQEACARLAVAKKSVVAARESLTLVQRQYEGGSATITRYLEAELAYSQARMAATAAWYDRESRLADIARAVGQEVKGER